MQKMSLILLLFAIAICVSAGNLKTTPPSTTTIAAQKQQGTEANPVFVKVLTDANTAAIESKRESEATAAKQASDEKVVELTGKIKDFNGYLVLVGIIQALIFLGQLFVFWKQAEKLQKSIESNERIERPYVFVESFRIRRRPGSVIADTNAWFFSVKWKNVGRTPALIESLEIKIVDKDELPAAPDYTGHLNLEFVYTLAANKSFSTREAGPATPMKNGEAIRYVVYGRITYKDLSGNMCHTAFAQEISPNMPVCSSLANEAYSFFD